MSYEVSPRKPFQFQVDLAGLTPWFCGAMTVAAAAESLLTLGHRQVPAAELLEWKPQADSGAPFLLVGDWSRAINVGAGMWQGNVRVESTVGAGAGRMMSGGSLWIGGDAGDWTGQSMRGGLLHVTGSVGALTGGPIDGRPTGMNGGTIVVDGHCGSHAGYRMRRGNLVVHGNCGPAAGYAMRGGNLYCGGIAGAGAGVSARRGMILLRNEPAGLDSGFRWAGRFTPAFTGYWQSQLEKEVPGIWMGRDPIGPVRMWSGDWLYGGKAELLLAD